MASKPKPKTEDPAAKMVESLRKSLDKEVLNFHKAMNQNLNVQKQAFKEMKDRFESWEETLLFVYHNIKKNQFLYAHYPDEWVKKYSDIKQGLRDENEAMDERKLTA